MADIIKVFKFIKKVGSSFCKISDGKPPTYYFRYLKTF